MHHHCGFGRSRSTTDYIFCIRQILEKNGSLMGQYTLFMDFEKVCDSVSEEVLYNVSVKCKFF
jgi:hypothetical protein